MAGLSYSEWSRRIVEISRDVPKGATSKTLTRLASAAVDKLVERSPVGNPALWIHPAPAGYAPGTFKNNWFVDIGGISPRERPQPDAAGAASLAEKSRLLAIRSNPYVIVWVHNSVPYARRIEHGWSSQAPAGVVSVTAAYITTLQ